MRGAALLLVLWLIVLLTALVGGFALTARTEDLQGQRAAAAAWSPPQAARAGVEYAITRVGNGDPTRAGCPTAAPTTGTSPTRDVEIADRRRERARSTSTMPTPACSRRCSGAGRESRGDADALAAAIVDWRDADALTQPDGGAEDPDYAAAGLPYGAKDAPFENRRRTASRCWA